MLPVSEIAPNGQQNAQNHTQSQVIASVIAQQRVIATQRSGTSADAGSEHGPRQNRVKSFALTVRAERQPKEANSGESEQTRSIIEAQEANPDQKKITAAFQSRRDLTELLSVIRDPGDVMLPNDPDDLA